MAASKAEYLDLKRPRNYVHYIVGIVVESVAVLALMIVAYGVSGLGFWLF
jgi:hypothetical protein